MSPRLKELNDNPYYKGEGWVKVFRATFTSRNPLYIGVSGQKVKVDDFYVLFIN